uniref:Secreted protein n=1 Tax=Rhizophora mucronata TaxID=61149 RepID=A0A2P2N028_RHIMU
MAISFISCIIFNTCHIAGLCSGDVKLQTLASSVSIPSWFSSPPSSSLTALTQSNISAGTRYGCCDGCFPVKSSNNRTPNA